MFTSWILCICSLIPCSSENHQPHEEAKVSAETSRAWAQIQNTLVAAHISGTVNRERRFTDANGVTDMISVEPEEFDVFFSELGTIVDLRKTGPTGQRRHKRWVYRAKDKLCFGLEKIGDAEFRLLKVNQGDPVPSVNGKIDEYQWIMHATTRPWFQMDLLELLETSHQDIHNLEVSLDHRLLEFLYDDKDFGSKQMVIDLDPDSDFRILKSTATFDWRGGRVQHQQIVSYDKNEMTWDNSFKLPSKVVLKRGDADCEYDGDISTYRILSAKSWEPPAHEFEVEHYGVHSRSLELMNMESPVNTSRTWIWWMAGSFGMAMVFFWMGRSPKKQISRN